MSIRKGVASAIVVGFIVVGWCSTAFPQQQSFAPSPVISGVTWDFSSHRKQAVGSDVWSLTWAANDHQYTTWGDGGGFGGTNNDGRVELGVARIEGTARAHTGRNVWGGKNPENPATFGGKSFGLLAIDSTLYMWRSTSRSPFNKAELYFSNDYGASWKSVGWAFENLGGAFSVPTFLNFGKNYQGARDSYVYIYAPANKANTEKFESVDGVELARVPKSQIKVRSAYAFFAGLDNSGKPRWTANISQRQPVFVYPGKVHWTMSVAYNPGFRRYLLFNNAHPYTGSSSSPSALEIFDAREPWGPWTRVASYKNWGNFGYTFSYYLAPKWLSTNGKDFTLVFSGIGAFDAWNTITGKFILRDSTPTADAVPPKAPGLSMVN